jgi:LPS export ABC transporter protein LptC
MQRISFIAIPGMVAITLFFGLDWFDTVSNDAPPQDQPVAENLEAYAEGINTILFDANGLVDYTLQADRQLHYRDQVTVLEAPFIRMFREGESRWNIVSDSGRISPATDSGNSIENIELTGNVELYLMDEAGSRTVLSMNRLSIDPNLETLNTEDQVVMVSDNLKQTADGMFASLTEEIITFKRNVNGRYSPPGKPLEELESNVSN